MLPRILWLVVGLLLSTPTYAQELSPPTPDGEMALEQLLTACREAKATADPKPGATSRVGLLVDAAKLATVVADHRESLKPALLDALLFRLSEATDDGTSTLIALLEAVGKSSRDELAVAQSVYFQGRRDERQLRKYAEALEHYNHAYEEFVKFDSRVWQASVLHRRGAVYALQQSWDLAIQDSDKALAIRRELYGDEHPDVAHTLHNLAICYRNVGKPDLSIEYNLKSLAIRKKTRGDCHADVAMSLAALAELYLGQAKYAEAKDYYQQLATLRESLLGDTHVDTLASRRGMGYCEQMLAHYSEAMAIYQDVLSLRQQKLGAQHPDVASSYFDIGTIFDRQGNYADACKSYKKSWELFKAAFSDDHANTLASRRAMGWCHQQRNEFEAAQQIYQEVYDLRLKALGEGHLAVADALIDVGVVSDRRSRFNEALDCFRRALRIREEVAGRRSPEAASAWRWLGETHFHLQQYAEALSDHRHALGIYEALPNHQREHAATLAWIGDIYIEQGEFDQSLRAYRQALDLREKHFGREDPDVATSMASIGHWHRRTAKWAEAVSWFERALALRMRLFGDDNLETAATLWDLGNTFELQREYSKASERYKSVLAVRLKLLGEHDNRVADVTRSIGNVCYCQGRYSEALGHYQRTLAIRTDCYGRASTPVADSLFDISLVQQQLEAFTEAIDYQQQALQIYTQVVGTRSEKIAYVHEALGVSYAGLREHQKALDHQRIALDLRERLFGDNHPSLAGPLERIGFSWFALGEYRMSIEAFLKAADARSHNGDALDPFLAYDHLHLAQGYAALGMDRLAFEHIAIASPTVRIVTEPLFSKMLLYREAMVYSELGMHLTAKEKLQKVLAILREIKDAPPGEVADCIAEVAFFEAKLGQYEQSSSHFEQALSLLKTVYSDRNQKSAWILYWLGVCHANRSHYAEALQYCDQALQGLSVVPAGEAAAGGWSAAGLQGIPLTTWVLRYRGWILEQRLGASPSKEALLECDRAYELAAALLAKVRNTTLRADESRIELAAGNQHLLPGRLRIYHRLFQLEADKKYLAAAYAAIEEATARVFLEALGKSRAEKLGGLTGDVQEKQHELESRLKQVDTALSTERNRKLDERRPDRIEELVQQQKALEYETERLADRLEREFPRYSAIKHPKPCSLEQARACLGENEVALFYVVEYDSKTHLLVLEGSPSHATGGVGLALFELPDKTELSELAATVLNERALMKKSRRGDPRDEAYRVLLGPVEEIIRGKNLVIVPSGDLCHLPFELLTCPSERGGRPRYLIENCRIRYAPSLTVLHLTREWEKTRAPIGHTLWAVGDPIYAAADPRRQSEQAALTAASERQLNEYRSRSGGENGTGGLRFERLSNSGDEVARIAGLFPTPQLLVGLEASEAAVKKASSEGKLAQARYVHFATHGILGFDDGRQQSLVLNLVGNDDEDGFLQLDEVTHLMLNADLVVLSACNTGEGRLRKGEGVSGLARAFMHAGSRGVLCSLWQVDDRATSELMVNTYRRLVVGMSAADALREAQLDMIADEKPPRFWAPFILIGE